MKEKETKEKGITDNRRYAYIRVSSKEQNWNRQIDRIKEYKIPEQNIFYEKISGKDFRRREYSKLKKKLQAGDTLIITGLDRLGRNYREIKEEWQSLTKKQVRIKVLDMPILESTEQNDLVRNFVSQIVLEILSFVAEQERINIKERQREGIEAAKRRGIRFGRPPKEITQIAEVIRQYQSKEVSLDKICADCQISRATFYRLKKKWEEENRKNKYQKV